MLTYKQINGLVLFTAVLLSPLWAGGKSDSEISFKESNYPDYKEGKDYFPEKVQITHAENFSVSYHNNYKHVTIFNPWPGSTEPEEYILVQRGTPPPESLAHLPVIEIPLKSIAALSLTYMVPLEILGELDTLVALDSLRYTTRSAVVERINQGKIMEIGGGPELNLEKVYLLSPDIVMTSATGGNWDTHPRLRETGITVVINGDWIENSPLGRAEWIKFISLFYNKEKIAREFFDQTLEQYKQVADLVPQKEEPAVLAAAPYRGQWTLPGGDSYKARLIDDAGGNYIWKERKTTGSLFRDIEEIYSKAGKADVWIIGSQNWKTKADMLNEDQRVSLFSAFQQDRVFNNDLRTNRNGGNDYWESGPYYPQRVLADMIKMFYPEILPGYELYYYRRIP